MSVPFTPEEDAQILKLRAQGKPFRVIADRLDRHGSSCNKRYLFLVARDHKKPQPAKKKVYVRKCLGCRQTLETKEPGTYFHKQCRGRDWSGDLAGVHIMVAQAARRLGA